MSLNNSQPSNAYCILNLGVFLWILYIWHVLLSFSARPEPVTFTFILLTDWFKKFKNWIQPFTSMSLSSKCKGWLMLSASTCLLGWVIFINFPSLWAFRQTLCKRLVEAQKNLYLHGLSILLHTASFAHFLMVFSQIQQKSKTTLIMLFVVYIYSLFFLVSFTPTQRILNRCRNRKRDTAV